MSSPRVRRYILESLGIEPCFHSFPKEDGSRLLLLDGGTLESLAKWLGALACADALRRVTDGATVRGLKAALPGVYPEVFGYVAYFSNSDLPRADASKPEEILGAGCSVLLRALERIPAPLVSRLKFKFLKDLASTCLAPRLADGRGSSGEKREKAKASILKLLKLKFPEAYKLCCS